MVRNFKQIVHGQGLNTSEEYERRRISVVTGTVPVEYTLVVRH